MYFRLILLVFFTAFEALAITADEIIARHDANLSSKMIAISKLEVNGGEKTFRRKFYVDKDKLVSENLYPTKGSKSLRIGSDSLYYNYGRDVMSRAPNLIYSIPLLSSALYFDDMTRIDLLTGYKAKLLREEKKEGFSTYVLELTNEEGKSVSTFYKRLVWIDKASFVAVFQEYYKEDDTLMRYSRVAEVAKRGKYHFAKKTELWLPDSDKKTLYEIQYIKFDAHIPDKLFSKVGITAL